MRFRSRHKDHTLRRVRFIQHLRRVRSVCTYDVAKRRIDSPNPFPTMEIALSLNDPTRGTFISPDTLVPDAGVLPDNKNRPAEDLFPGWAVR